MTKQAEKEIRDIIKLEKELEKLMNNKMLYRFSTGREFSLILMYCESEIEYIYRREGHT